MWYCVLIAMFVLFLVYKYLKLKQRTCFSVGIYLIVLYLCSVACSFLVDNSNKVYSLEASCYFVVVLLLFLFPILKYDTTKVNKIALHNPIAFKCLCDVFIVGGICAYIYFLPVVYNLFFSGTSLLILRTDMVGGESYYETNVFYYVVTFLCQFYPVVLVCYFFSITHLCYSKHYNNLLLFSSTAYIVNVLSNVGRDGVVLWSMSYIFTFILFYRFLSKEQIRWQRRLFKRLLFVFMLFFVPITVARFFINGFKDGVMSIFSYFGQEFGNFNNFYNEVDFGILGVDFSGILPIIGRKQTAENILLEQESFYNLFGVDKFVFGTFLATFYLNIGPILTFVWAGIHSIVNSILIKTRPTISFGTILYLTLLAQLPLHGIFYYKWGYNVSNIYVICVIFMSLFFSYRVKWKMSR